ncbi:hypothetical protein CHPC361_000610 [Lactococcus phage CHPC361]|uniref:Uncharacterized protein n=1 Tax=Lactococcus phage CHPC361 TaxID=2675249 RepID=A0A650F7P7_9CAUD|nr:hypothetical protein HYQ11_gp46 [Lactococcus phage CHPC361]QGT52955.1 hypothetical protein CHPC361_000610 [Lactococcus phage CHPC361]
MINYENKAINLHAEVETPIETTKESAQAFLDLAKGQGKVIEND